MPTETRANAISGKVHLIILLVYKKAKKLSRPVKKLSGGENNNRALGRFAATKGLSK